MGKYKDISGQKFGRLTAIRRVNTKIGNSRWLCKCDCGNECIAMLHHLQNSTTVSCGCKNKENAKGLLTKHGMSKTPLYRVWCGMKRRCDNPKMPNNKYYYKKGISVCDEWQDFMNFYRDMKDGYEKGLTIERIDGNKGYNKENCKWATKLEQSNNISSNIIIELNGERDTLPNMCRKYNLNYGKISSRLKNGWSVEKTFNTP